MAVILVETCPPICMLILSWSVPSPWQGELHPEKKKKGDCRELPCITSYQQNTGFEIAFCYLYKQLACYYFMNVPSRHKLPELEVKDFITHRKASSVILSTLALSSCPQSHGEVSIIWSRLWLHMQWVCFTSREYLVWKFYYF